MKRVIVIGCPGSGKTTFAEKLHKNTGLPLFHLDAIWHALFYCLFRKGVSMRKKLIQAV